MNKREPDIPWESVALVEPSDRLDEGISGLIAAARMQHAMARRGVHFWVLAASCSACLVLGFLANSVMYDAPRTEGAPAIVIEISPEDLPPEFFVIKKARETSFFEKTHSEVVIEFQTPAGEKEL